MRPLILGDPSKRTQTRSGSGVVFNFVDLRSRIFFTRRGLAAVSHAHPKSNLAVAQERSAKVSYAKQQPQSVVQHFSNSIINEQATSKTRPLHPFQGFFCSIVR